MNQGNAKWRQQPLAQCIKTKERKNENKGGGTKRQTSCSEKQCHQLLVNFINLQMIIPTLFARIFATSPAQYLALPRSFLLQTLNPSRSSVDQISFPDLQRYSSQYFQVGNGGVSVFSPGNGATTDNGAGARTQLEDRGYHEMQFTQTVHEASMGKVCIGQVKGVSMNMEGLQHIPQNLRGSCLIVVEYIYDIGSRQLVANFRDKDCNDVKVNMGYFSTGQAINTSFVVNGVTVTVTNNKGRTTFDYTHFSRRNYIMNFKVGAYNQGSGGAGSKTTLSRVSINHSGEY